MTNDNGRGQPPPITGAFDLNQLRQPSDREREMLQAASVQLLTQAGLLCACGERVRDDGVELVSLVLTATPTPSGPQPTLGLAVSTFHSRTCPAFTATLATDDAQVVAVRSAPQTDWIIDDEQ